MEMKRNGNAQGKGITYRAFHFAGHEELREVYDRV
jgi:hypothetical protein